MDFYFGLDFCQSKIHEKMLREQLEEKAEKSAVLEQKAKQKIELFAIEIKFLLLGVMHFYCEYLACARV